MYNLLTYKSFQIEVQCFGVGDHWILAFNGFGRSGLDYEIFSKELGDNYRILAVELFHHGESQFPSERVFSDPLKDEEWLEIIQFILRQYSIDRFSIFGFSLGGKLSLALLQHMGRQIDSIALMAPDGLVTNPWYGFATHRLYGRLFFRWMMNHPSVLFTTAALLNKLSFVPGTLYRFAKTQLDSPEKRQLVLDTWLTYRAISPNVEKALGELARHSIPALIILGKHDRVISPQLKEKIRQMGTSDLQIELVNEGHFLLTPATARMVAEWMKTKKAP